MSNGYVNMVSESDELDCKHLCPAISPSEYDSKGEEQRTRIQLQQVGSRKVERRYVYPFG